MSSEYERGWNAGYKARSDEIDALMRVLADPDISDDVAIESANWILTKNTVTIKRVFTEAEADAPRHHWSWVWLRIASWLLVLSAPILALALLWLFLR